MKQSEENIMLKQNKNITILAALGLACSLLASMPAAANPEKDINGNDISSRIPVDIAIATMSLSSDDFRAPPTNNMTTGSIDEVAKCSRQTPSACVPASKPSH
jgi:hypothetical protein